MNKMGYTTESGIQVCPAYNFLKSINLGDYIAYIESLINEYSDELTNERRLLYGLPIDPNYLEEVSKDNTPKRILK